MHGVYLACLIGGAVATAIFVVIGGLGGGGHGHAGAHHVGSPTHGHVGGPVHGHGTSQVPGHAVAHIDTHAHIHPSPGHAAHLGARGVRFSSVAGWTLSWISPLTIAAAALWFGGVGLLAERALGSFGIILAAIAAVTGAFLIRSAMAAFMRADTPPLMLTGEGALATVNATIRPGAPGEVIYTLEGLTRSAPARSLDGQVIARGTSVAIVKSEAGFAWVAPIDGSEEDLGTLISGDGHENAELKP